MFPGISDIDILGGCGSLGKMNACSGGKLDDITKNQRLKQLLLLQGNERRIIEKECFIILGQEVPDFILPYIVYI